jgi:hypothetical protein
LDKFLENSFSYKADEQICDVTVFILDCGEPSVWECIKHLRYQRHLFYCFTIQNKKPIGAAFSAMAENCRTKYYVQVDCDMLLKPHAIGYLHEKIKATSVDTAFFCGWLWGDAEKQPIQGVKIFRHEIIEKVPYGSDYTYDFKYNQKLMDAGYKIEIDKKPDDESGCLGLHWSLQDPLRSYKRWFTMTRKLIEFPEHYGYVEKIISKLDNESARLGAKHAREGRSIENAQSELEIAKLL